MKMIAECGNHTLIELNLNFLAAWFENEQCFLYLLKTITLQRNLKELNLQFCALDGPKIKRVFDTLRASPSVATMETMNLNVNDWTDPIGYQSFCALVDVAYNLRECFIGYQKNKKKFSVELKHVERGRPGKIVVKRDNLFKKLLYELPTTRHTPCKIVWI